MSNKYVIHIVFSKPKNYIIPPIISWIIRWVEKTDCSHVFLRFPSLGYIFHAHMKYGVSLMNDMDYLKSIDIMHIYKYYTTKQEFEEILNYCHEEHNQHIPYSFLQLIGQLYLLLLKNKTHPNPFKDQDKKQICTEAVSYILQNFCHIKLPYPADNIGLSDLLKILDNDKRFIKIK